MTELKTRAEIQGERIVINGVKRWCSCAGHALGYVLYCPLADKPGAAGAGAVYLEKGTPGLSFGKPEQFMGARGFHNAEIYLDNVEVPVENIVVPAGGV
jgi:butyryl-CoA dehydrogenase